MDRELEAQLIDSGDYWPLLQLYQQWLVSQYAVSSLVFWRDLNQSTLYKVTPDKIKNERIDRSTLSIIPDDPLFYVQLPYLQLPAALRTGDGSYCLVASRTVNQHTCLLVGFVDILPEDDEIKPLFQQCLMNLQRSALIDRVAYQDEILHGLQQQVARSESMSMLGEMVGAVTHEINNPLGVSITGLSHLKGEVKQLIKGFEAGELTEDSFSEFVEECTDCCQLLEFNLNRAVSLVQGFKKTAVDQSAFKLVVFDICENINNLMASISPEIKRHGVKLSINLPASARTKGFPGALSQIITNLSFNAIRHAFIGVEAPQITLTGAIDADGDTFTLLFEDNGTGIPAEIQHAVFEPYFTTKGDCGGSGLGMSIARELAEKKLAGSLTLDEQCATGARFVLTMPVLP